MLGIQPGDDGVVIGESERGKRGDHRVGDDAVFPERGEGRGRISVEEIATESVERDEEHGLRLPERERSGRHRRARDKRRQ
jgi:hypothetical protein